MVQEKNPTFIARKAVKKDLKRLNEIQPSEDGEIKERDLSKIIVLEINGKVRGMLFYNPKKQSVTEATASPLITQFVAGLAKKDFEKAKKDKEFERLIRRYGPAKLAKMYEQKMGELTKKKN